MLKPMNQSNGFWQAPFTSYIVEGGAGGSRGMQGTGGASGGVESLEPIPGVNMEEYSKLSPSEQRKVIVEKMKEAQSLGDKAAAKAQKEYDARLSEISTKEANLQPVIQLKEALEKDPKLQKIVADYASGKSSERETNEEFNDLLDEATPEERKMLKKIKKFVLADVPKPESSNQELESLKEKVKFLESQVVNVNYERSEATIEKLRNDYSKDIIGKYESKLRELLIRYPTAKPEQLLFGLSGLSENREDLHAAVKFNSEKSNKVAEDLKLRGLDPSGRAIKTDVEFTRIKTSKGKDDVKASLSDYIKRKLNLKGQ